ncbi:T9SS type A sorting domain-containing protein [Chryseobacterium sp. KACC 21268]|nr:T9SS type A sorting domain-containing protein [Chryseobacterium sp. KACC 21268]
MKRILFSLIATSAIFYSANAQTKISFETSEGYNAGALDGQLTWTAWGDAPISYTSLSTAKASDGVRSVKILSDESVEANYGIESTVPSYNKAVISYDINVEALNGSDNFFLVYSDEYDVVAAVDFDYTGAVAVSDATSEDLIETSKSFSANTWYNVKIELDFGIHEVKYYVNSELLHTGAIDSSLTGYGIVDLMTDDYGTSFYVDNIQVTDATLATSEVSKKDIFRVYPNPTVDVVNFDVAGKINSVEVYDAAGKLVKTANGGAKSINVSELSKGNYVVKVKTENASYTKKVIKK